MSQYTENSTQSDDINQILYINLQYNKVLGKFNSNFWVKHTYKKIHKYNTEYLHNAITKTILYTANPWYMGNAMYNNNQKIELHLRWTIK